jgi:ATP-dependent Lon protease
MRDDTAFMDRIHAYVPGWDVPKMAGDLFTNHFGLVSDFLSECWSRMRTQSWLPLIHERVRFGSALSGRDVTAVTKTTNGLLKLLFPSNNMAISDEDLEWAVRVALESRRRVKEQQKRIGSAEFRNTHFSYAIGDDGVEQFVSTPELHAEGQIGNDPLPPGQSWVIGMGGGSENIGLYAVEVTQGPGSGVRIVNKPAPAPFQESVRAAEQNLYAFAKQLVGDRDPRQHEFWVQLRALDASKTGSQTSVAVLLAACSALLEKSLRGGLVIVGSLTLGGGLEAVYNAVSIAELAIEKGASTLLIPVSARKQVNDLSDDMVTKISILFYVDARDALAKALGDR